ncbi:ribosome silencing factor [Thermophilibacter immobilis]|jgi:ribosome-associated protein|uniref:Ribosomal silencing factor RsfS n=1 Tax=Thermophilibacter immobilis TaxID=2779519 RepID=A0A7S7M702_9ACTN|nr:ribosome silencing factor [Thermophilibacter immobilis]QOY59879.1 ribosome silencing factor [Thermophilibacter immobilis]
MPQTPLELARVAALAADAKKAADIVLLDLSSKTDVCDYFLICTGATARQVDAIVDEVRERVHANCAVSPLSCEGRAQLSWVLLDYGSVVVHVFQPEARAFYRLESLWGDADRVELDLAGANGDA